MCVDKMLPVLQSPGVSFSQATLRVDLTNFSWTSHNTKLLWNHRPSKGASFLLPLEQNLKWALPLETSTRSSATLLWWVSWRFCKAAVIYCQLVDGPGFNTCGFMCNFGGDLLNEDWLTDFMRITRVNIIGWHNSKPVATKLKWTCSNQLPSICNMCPAQNKENKASKSLFRIPIGIVRGGLSSSLHAVYGSDSRDYTWLLN